MALVKFNKSYQDHELERKVEANEEVEMTVKRADELVKVIRSQAYMHKGYDDFDYERLDKGDEKESENDVQEDETPKSETSEDVNEEKVSEDSEDKTVEETKKVAKKTK